MNKSSVNTWDADLYDSKIRFVSEQGKEVVHLLKPQPGERILDLGCGTGDLTYEIARSGAIPLGIDLSPSMVEKARRKFPDLQFAVVNAETFRTTEQFDAVFSNAALHWMKGAAEVIKSVWLALRPGGRFVAEFGGKGNVNTIMKGITGVLAEHGISAAERNPWYFPSIGEYCSLLEQQGFHVTYAVHFDHPPLLEGGESGLKHWLHMFCDDFFQTTTAIERETMMDQIAEKLKPVLYQNGTWFADYRRIRIRAVKE